MALYYYTTILRYYYHHYYYYYYYCYCHGCCYYAITVIDDAHGAIADCDAALVADAKYAKARLRHVHAP